MINKNNYFAEVQKFGVDKLTPTLAQGHELIKKLTKDGSTWTFASAALNTVIENQLKLINAYAEQHKPAAPVKKGPHPKAWSAVPKHTKKSPSASKKRGYPHNQVYMDIERNKVVLISLETGKKWANEYFKSKDEAIEFTRQNGLILAPAPDSAKAPKKVSAADQKIIDLANTITHYERGDNDEPEITDLEEAKKIVAANKKENKKTPISKKRIRSTQDGKTIITKKEANAKKPLPSELKKVAKTAARSKAKKVSSPSKAKSKTKTAKPKIAKAPVTVTRKSLELQHIQRYLNLNGRSTKVGSITSLASAIHKALELDSYLNHKTLLSEIGTKLNKISEQLKETKQPTVDVGLSPEFVTKCKEILASAKVRYRTEYLAGTKDKKPWFGFGYNIKEGDLVLQAQLGYGEVQTVYEDSADVLFYNENRKEYTLTNIKFHEQGIVMVKDDKGYLRNGDKIKVSKYFFSAGSKASIPVRDIREKK